MESKNKEVSNCNCGEETECCCCCSCENYAQEIEEKRAALYKEFNANRKISNIMTFAILIIAIGGMYCVTAGGILTIVGWALLGAGLVAMILFYFLSKKKFESHTKEYISFISTTLNNETFKCEKFKDITVSDGKLEVADMDGNGAYSDIVRVASRNIITGSYDGISFKFAEAGIFKKSENKKQPAMACFVGKYFDATNTLKFDGNIVIDIAREKPFDTPNGVANKATLYGQDGVTVYGDEGMNFRDIIGEEFFGKLKKLKVERHLLNCVVSIKEGHTHVFMSYDDDVIAMPFDKSFNKEAFETFVDDLKNVFEIIKYLGK